MIRVYQSQMNHLPMERPLSGFQSFIIMNNINECAHQSHREKNHISFILSECSRIPIPRGLTNPRLVLKGTARFYLDSLFHFMFLLARWKWPNFPVSARANLGCELDMPEKREPHLIWGITSIRLAFGHVCGTFSSLMIDIEGLSLLWVAACLQRRAWAIYNKGTWVWARTQA